MTSKSIHLTSHQRSTIEALLGEQNSLRYIANRIGKAPSTVSRVVRNHTKVIIPKCRDCVFTSGCKMKQICGYVSCRKLCKACSKAKKYCADYIQSICEVQLDHVCRLCNDCKKQPFCHYTKRLYVADEAEKAYREKLVCSRNGFDLTGEQFMQINEIVTPAIRKGQSVFHIVKTYGDRLPVSKSTIRRLIQKCELDVRDVELPETVRRRHHRKAALKPSVSKSGHLYSDYLAYLADNDVAVVEMDCVEDCKDDPEAILTFHLTTFKIQLYYILEEHTAMNK